MFAENAMEFAVEFRGLYSLPILGIVAIDEFPWVSIPPVKWGQAFDSSIRASEMGSGLRFFDSSIQAMDRGR